MKVLFGDAGISCKMLFLKGAKLSGLLIHLSRLFHSITVDGKKEFLKNMSNIELGNVVDIFSCSICVPSGGDFIKQILRGFIFSYLKEIAKFSKPPPLLYGFQT